MYLSGRNCWSWAAAQVKNFEEVTQRTKASWQDVWWGLFFSEGLAAARFTWGEIIRLKTHGTSYSLEMENDIGFIFTQDKIVAAHPAVANELTCKIVERSNNVIDGNLITGKGIGTVVDFALGIIRKFFGHGRAKSVANGIVFEYPKSWSTKELLKLRKAQHIYGCNQRSGYLWSW